MSGGEREARCIGQTTVAGAGEAAPSDSVIDFLSRIEGVVVGAREARLAYIRQRERELGVLREAGANLQAYGARLAQLSDNGSRPRGT